MDTAQAWQPAGADMAGFESPPEVGFWYSKLSFLGEELRFHVVFLFLTVATGWLGWARLRNGRQGQAWLGESGLCVMEGVKPRSGCVFLVLVTSGMVEVEDGFGDLNGLRWCFRFGSSGVSLGVGDVFYSCE